MYLPDDVLKMVYHDNAARLFGLWTPRIRPTPLPRKRGEEQCSILCPLTVNVGRGHGAHVQPATGENIRPQHSVIHSR